MASKSQLKLSDIIRKEYLKPMAVSIGLMFFQQFSGINAVMFYSVISYLCKYQKIRLSTISNCGVLEKPKSNIFFLSTGIESLQLFLFAIRDVCLYMSLSVRDSSELFDLQFF
jgi:hypothetical protein